MSTRGAPSPRAIDHPRARRSRARPGSAAYLCAEPASRSCGGASAPTPVQGLPYGSRSRSGRTVVSLHPAGHVLGSAQLRVQGPAVCGSSLATTSARRTRPARRSSRCVATRSSPRARSACRSTAGIRPRRSSPSSRRGGTQPRAGPGLDCVLLHDRQGPAAARGARADRRNAGPRARHAGAGDRRLPGRRRDACGRPRRWSSARVDVRWPASWCWRRLRRAARHGCAVSAISPTRSPRA